MTKRRYFHTVLNNEPFIQDLKCNRLPSMEHSFRDIYSAYDRPSQTKIAIWEYWKRWQAELQHLLKTDFDYDMWISSRNGFQFTISGYCYDSINRRYICFHITKTKNVFWLVNA